MKVFSRFVSISGIFLLTLGIAYGAENPLKIGYVDLQKGLNDSQSGQKAKKTITGLVSSKQKIIEEKRAEIEKLRAEIEKQSTVLSPEAKKQKEEKLERDQRDLQRIARDAQEELQKKELELTNSIIKEMREIVKKIAEEEGYTFVLLHDENIILYSTPAHDLTEKVIKRYDQAQKK
ncbi:MAG: OmpH family outer membrane protein [Nitrospirota bacterium]